jgi:O-methyltransferase involved in polyketide biosynthesis
MDKQLQDNTLQSTMLIPLYGRMIAGRRFPDILRDTTAERICEDVEYDFSGISKTYGGEYASISCLVRAATIDTFARTFIERHPNSVVINLGSGLDDTFSRVDNGTIYWYNLDLPDAIAYRERFITPTERCKNIAQSMFDYSWLNTIPTPSDGHVLILATGLFYYFEESKIKELFLKISEQFAHGELCFETFSKKGMEIANRMVQKSGNVGAEMKSWTDNPQQVQEWSPTIKEVVFLPYLGKHSKDKRLSFLTRVIMRGCDALKRTKFVRVNW